MTVTSACEELTNGHPGARYVVVIEHDDTEAIVATFEHRSGDEPGRARRHASACAIRVAASLGCSALVCR